MAEHEININLNDATQSFNAQGNPTGSTGIPLVDPSVLEAYRAIVDRFEERITNAPVSPAAEQRQADNETTQSIFFPRNEAERRSGNNDIEIGGEDEEDRPRRRRRRPRRRNEPESDVDPIEEYIIDRMNQDVEPWGSGGGDSGGGGSGVNPNSVTGGPTGGGVINPPGTGGPPGGVGGPPGGGLPPGSMTGAAAGPAALLGPAGVAVIAAVGAIEGLILVGEGLTTVIEALDDTMQSVVEDIKGFSPEVAQASAAANIADMMVKLDRASEIGPDIARWLETRTEIDMLLGRTATEITRDFLPLIQKGTESLIEILTVVSVSSEYLKPLVDVMIENDPITNALEAVGIKKYIDMGLKVMGVATEYLRAQKIAQIDADAKAIQEDFQNWLDNQALDPLPDGQRVGRMPRRVIPVVGGGGA